ncbi:serine/threonine-protein kinase D6PKL2 [Tanacetum coccineum]|uniref:non-specific serine/threonine protein kinase n=1 Tax=Tanacetum coccineum TaxID=301880 RepID=A0ABQ5A365_9ASTR
MAIGVLVVVLILLFQARKLLPTGRKNTFYFGIMVSVLGAGSFVIDYFSKVINSLLLNFGISQEIQNPAFVFAVLGIILFGAAFGYWLVRKYIISDDGEVDVGVAQFVKWSMFIVAVTCIFQSTNDNSLAMVAIGFFVALYHMIARMKSPSHFQTPNTPNQYFSPHFPAMELPWTTEDITEDITEDFYSISFNSTTTTTATDINRSTSSSTSETTWTTATYSSSSKPTLNPSPTLSLHDLRFIHRLGAGDTGSVYLSEMKKLPLVGSTLPAVFAAKVMDRRELASRNKEGRSRTEREILEALDHPFLPRLYAAIETPKWTCLLTEFCPGGDLHVLRQRQPCKRFPESAVRFYASEVVVAIEYLHMLDIVYRDLKPENVLVRSDGHIMLTDFDLSLKCDVTASTPAQVFSGPNNPTSTDHYTFDPPKVTSSSCIIPNCIVPSVSCFNLRRRRKKKPENQTGPQFVAEPVDVRSMSFVGTHEYLAPEIVSGEGHGSAVDWWTLGIFMFELFYGVTPFRGMDNELTLANIVARALEFPKEPAIPPMAKDLISQLLAKDPARRLGSTMGASAIKHHSFFQGVNWALLRCTKPPFVPPPFNISSREVVSDDSCPDTLVDYF